MTILNHQRDFFHNLSKLSLVTLIAIGLTRIWAISLFYIFGKDSQTINKIINDPWHHYQVGLILVAVALLFGRLKRFKFLFAIGLGIFLEEWPVFLNDLGLNTNYLYHTKVDFISIFALVGLVYVLSKIFYPRGSLKIV